jgi:hypothetical protein
MKLTLSQQKEILYESFGFIVIDESPDEQDQNYVIYDENGHEFYGVDDNCKYDLSTIAGIIKYAESRGEKTGYQHCQKDFRKVLGI